MVGRQRVGVASLLVVIAAACGSHPATPIDASDPCAACGPTTQCVQLYDGTCNASAVVPRAGYLFCEPRVDGCELNACAPACESAYCTSQGGLYSCQDRDPCGTESQTAFTCYGP